MDLHDPNKSLTEVINSSVLVTEGGEVNLPLLSHNKSQNGLNILLSSPSHRSLNMELDFDESKLEFDISFNNSNEFSELTHDNIKCGTVENSVTFLSESCSQSPAVNSTLGDASLEVSQPVDIRVINIGLSSDSVLSSVCTETGESLNKNQSFEGKSCEIADSDASQPKVIVISELTEVSPSICKVTAGVQVNKNTQPNVSQESEESKNPGKSSISNSEVVISSNNFVAIDDFELNFHEKPLCIERKLNSSDLSMLDLCNKSISRPLRAAAMSFRRSQSKNARSRPPVSNNSFLKLQRNFDSSKIANESSDALALHCSPSHNIVDTSSNQFNEKIGSHPPSLPVQVLLNPNNLSALLNAITVNKTPSLVNLRDNEYTGQDFCLFNAQGMNKTNDVTNEIDFQMGEEMEVEINANDDIKIEGVNSLSADPIDFSGECSLFIPPQRERRASQKQIRNSTFDMTKSSSTSIRASDPKLLEDGQVNSLHSPQKVGGGTAARLAAEHSTFMASILSSVTSDKDLNSGEVKSAVGKKAKRKKFNGVEYLNGADSDNMNLDSPIDLHENGDAGSSGLVVKTRKKIGRKPKTLGIVVPAPMPIGGGDGADPTVLISAPKKKRRRRFDDGYAAALQAVAQRRARLTENYLIRVSAAQRQATDDDSRPLNIYLSNLPEVTKNSARTEVNTSTNPVGASSDVSNDISNNNGVKDISSMSPSSGGENKKIRVSRDLAGLLTTTNTIVTIKRLREAELAEMGAINGSNSPISKRLDRSKVFQNGNTADEPPVAVNTHLTANANKSPDSNNLSTTGTETAQSEISNENKPEGAIFVEESVSFTEPRKKRSYKKRDPVSVLANNGLSMLKSKKHSSLVDVIKPGQSPVLTHAGSIDKPSENVPDLKLDSVDACNEAEVKAKTGRLAKMVHWRTGKAMSDEFKANMLERLRLARLTKKKLRDAKLKSIKTAGNKDSVDESIVEDLVSHNESLTGHQENSFPFSEYDSETRRRKAARASIDDVIPPRRGNRIRRKNGEFVDSETQQFNNPETSDVTMLDFSKDSSNGHTSVGNVFLSTEAIDLDAEVKPKKLHWKTKLALENAAKKASNLNSISSKFGVSRPSIIPPKLPRYVFRGGSGIVRKASHHEEDATPLTAFSAADDVIVPDTPGLMDGDFFSVNNNNNCFSQGAVAEHVFEKTEVLPSNAEVLAPKPKGRPRNKVSASPVAIKATVTPLLNNVDVTHVSPKSSPPSSVIHHANINLLSSPDSMLNRDNPSSREIRRSRLLMVDPSLFSAQSPRHKNSIAQNSSLSGATLNPTQDGSDLRNLRMTNPNASYTQQPSISTRRPRSSRRDDIFMPGDGDSAVSVVQSNESEVVSKPPFEEVQTERKRLHDLLRSFISREKQQENTKKSDINTLSDVKKSSDIPQSFLIDSSTSPLTNTSTDKSSTLLINPNIEQSTSSITAGDDVKVLNLETVTRPKRQARIYSELIEETLKFQAEYEEAERQKLENSLYMPKQASESDSSVTFNLKNNVHFINGDYSSGDVELLDGGKSIKQASKRMFVLENNNTQFYPELINSELATLEHGAVPKSKTKRAYRKKPKSILHENEYLDIHNRDSSYFGNHFLGSPMLKRSGDDTLISTSSFNNKLFFPYSGNAPPQFGNGFYSGSSDINSHITRPSFVDQRKISPPPDDTLAYTNKFININNPSSGIRGNELFPSSSPPIGTEPSPNRDSTLPISLGIRQQVSSSNLYSGLHSHPYATSVFPSVHDHSYSLHDLDHLQEKDLSQRIENRSGNITPFSMNSLGDSLPAKKRRKLSKIDKKSSSALFFVEPPVALSGFPNFNRFSTDFPATEWEISEYKRALKQQQSNDLSETETPPRKKKRILHPSYKKKIFFGSTGLSTHPPSLSAVFSRFSKNPESSNLNDKHNLSPLNSPQAHTSIHQTPALMTHATALSRNPIVGGQFAVDLNTQRSQQLSQQFNHLDVQRQKSPSLGSLLMNSDATPSLITTSSSSLISAPLSGIIPNLATTTDTMGSLNVMGSGFGRLSAASTIGHEVRGKTDYEAEMKRLLEASNQVEKEIQRQIDELKRQVEAGKGNLLVNQNLNTNILSNVENSASAASKAVITPFPHKHGNNF